MPRRPRSAALAVSPAVRERTGHPVVRSHACPRRKCGVAGFWDHQPIGVHGELAALAWNRSRGTSIRALAGLNMQKIPHYNVIVKEMLMTDRLVP